jgi:xanthine dehydrogenase YagT iron-sulfur-binding subunit
VAAGVLYTSNGVSGARILRGTNTMIELESSVGLQRNLSLSSEPLPSTIEIDLQINGAAHTLRIEPRVSLLDALRESLGLTGTKKGCNQGACGACTVLVDGERILSCLSLAVQHEGRAITTVEGLADGSPDNKALHPMQAAFLEQDGFQCGYCTPGQICSAIGMIREFQNGSPSAVSSDVSATGFEFSEEEIKERMSGNLCRCGAYVGISAAIREVLAAGMKL